MIINIIRFGSTRETHSWQDLVLLVFQNNGNNIIKSGSFTHPYLGQKDPEELEPNIVKL